MWATCALGAVWIFYNGSLTARNIAGKSVSRWSPPTDLRFGFHIRHDGIYQDIWAIWHTCTLM